MRRVPGGADRAGENTATHLVRVRLAALLAGAVVS
jgi:hypothetical protein